VIVCETFNVVGFEFPVFKKEQLPAFSALKLTAEKYRNHQVITRHVLSLS
jgi:hypothetical protein